MASTTDSPTCHSISGSHSSRGRLRQLSTRWILERLLLAAMGCTIVLVVAPYGSGGLLDHHARTRSDEAASLLPPRNFGIRLRKRIGAADRRARQRRTALRMGPARHKQLRKAVAACKREQERLRRAAAMGTEPPTTEATRDDDDDPLSEASESEDDKKCDLLYPLPPIA